MWTNMTRVMWRWVALCDVGDGGEVVAVAAANVGPRELADRDDAVEHDEAAVRHDVAQFVEDAVLDVPPDAEDVKFWLFFFCFGNSKLRNKKLFVYLVTYSLSSLTPKYMKKEFILVTNCVVKTKTKAHFDNYNQFEREFGYAWSAFDRAMDNSKDDQIV